jgi:hypothetical protein
MGYFPNLSFCRLKKDIVLGDFLQKFRTNVIANSCQKPQHLKTFGAYTPTRLFTRYTSVFRRADAKG